MCQDNSKTDSKSNSIKKKPMSASKIKERYRHPCADELFINAEMFKNCQAFSETCRHFQKLSHYLSDFRNHSAVVFLRSMLSISKVFSSVEV